MNYLKKKTTHWVAICMIAAFSLTPYAMNAIGLEAYTLSLQVHEMTLGELFERIEAESDYSFLIRNNDINLEEKISVDTEETSVHVILSTALESQEAEYRVNDNRIVVYKTNRPTPIAAAPVSTVVQQASKITGTIVDALTGEPVIGANIIVKGTTNGTGTDLDGNFTLDAPVGATLLVSYIGYVNQEVRATATPMIIRLSEDTKTLDEVVVVGYGVQKKESLIGAMQVVTNEKLTDATTPTVANLLSGKVPGVQVMSGSGQPGAAAKVIIRGKSTVNGTTDPLWVIDGVIVGDGPGSLNPADIESMSILKDAASTAIYGSMGANGVILITTKKGKAGEAKVNVSAKFGISQLHTGNLEMMNGAELYDYYKSFSNQEQINFERWSPELRNQNFDWKDQVTHLGFAQDYNISISGGTDKLRTYMSLGLYDEDGAVKGYDYKRYNLRFNAEYKPNKWLTVKPSVWGTRRDIMNQQHSISALYNNMPWDSPYDENGDLIQQNRPDSWVSSDLSNYLYNLQWNYTKYRYHEVMASFDFDVKLTDWLSFSSINNYKFGTTTYKTYEDPRSSGGESTEGKITDYNSYYYRIYTNQILRFNKTFGKHAVNALVATEWNTYTGPSFTQIATGFEPGFIVADVATNPYSVKGGQSEWAVMSYLFNSNYAYDSRYLFQFSFRRDGASNFGENARYGNFFSLGAGWNIHQEEFFTVDFVQQLKLRANYGSTGYRPSALYPHYALYSLGSGSYNGQTGALISQVGNKDLTWEKTFTTGVGIDAILFDRLTLSLDYYNKKTTDLLYQVPLPGVTGVTSVYRNVGEVNNKGFEMTFGVDIIKNQDWYWNVSGNLGLNRNKVVELYEGNDEIITARGGSAIFGVADKILKVGYDIDTWYTTEWAGVNPDNGAPMWYTTDAEGERVITGDYADASKNLVMCGRSTPDFYGGFSTEVSWKNFDLSAVFGYSVGGKIYNYNRSTFDSDGAYTSYNQQKLRKDWSRWEKLGDVATHPVAMYGNKSNSNAVSSRYLENASFLRLRNLTLGYNVPLKLDLISNLRVYFSGENLFVITGFSGIDPELPGNDDNGKVGVASSPYPQVRKFMFGLNVTF